MSIAEGIALSLLIKEVEGWNEKLMRETMSTKTEISIVMMESHICVHVCVDECVHVCVGE